MADRASRPDVFPSTRSTWLGDRLTEGFPGRQAALRHVMEVYEGPLRVYCRGSSFRNLGDPDDLVRAFLADRLARPEFLDRWRTSGRALRHWLIVSFKHFLYETARRMRRDEAVRSLEEIQSEPGSTDKAFDRACASAIVREATEAARALCEAEGMGEHWRVFALHEVDGLSYAEVARATGVPPARAAVMARTAARKLRSAIRASVGWEGAGEDEVDDEISALMEALTP